MPPPILLAYDSLSPPGRDDLLPSLSEWVESNGCLPIKAEDPVTMGGCQGCLFVVGPAAPGGAGAAEFRIAHRLGAMKALDQPIRVIDACGLSGPFLAHLEEAGIDHVAIPGAASDQVFKEGLVDWLVGIRSRSRA